MRIVVTGAAGLLGSALTASFGAEDEVTAFTRAGWTSRTTTASRLRRPLRPDVLLNAPPTTTWTPRRATRRTRCPSTRSASARWRGPRVPPASTLVHYSSDFVFHGETDPSLHRRGRAEPRSVYAASKLLGEWFAADAPASLRAARREPVRSARSGGPRPAASARSSTGSRAGEQVPVFADRTVSPSFTPTSPRRRARSSCRHAPPGLYHCVNSGHVTWLELAREAARLLGVELRVARADARDRVRAGARPQFCALSPARLAALRYGDASRGRTRSRGICSSLNARSPLPAADTSCRSPLQGWDARGHCEHAVNPGESIPAACIEPGRPVAANHEIGERSVGGCSLARTPLPAERRSSAVTRASRPVSTRRNPPLAAGRLVVLLRRLIADGRPDQDLAAPASASGARRVRGPRRAGSGYTRPLTSSALAGANSAYSPRHG